MTVLTAERLREIVDYDAGTGEFREGFLMVFQPQETQTPTEHHQDPVFRAMSELRKDGFGFEDIYVRLTKAGLAVTKAECRRFVIPKARRPAHRGNHERAEFPLGEGAEA